MIKTGLGGTGVRFVAIAAYGQQTNFCLMQIVANYTYICYHNNLSHIVRKPAFCICENKDADQLRGNREADQRLCFRYMYSAIPLLSKS